MTLQEQFNAINRGTGNKEQFLKHARNLFPQYLTKHLDYNTSINVLKTKQIISEQTNVVTKGFDIYDWKKILAEETKAEEKETSKEVKSKQDAYDATDVKNADNINGNEIWKGYYVEMKDPANADKTGDELKKIVVKNLSKDPLYYTKNGEFGIKGLGYTDEAPGLGKNTQPTSKNASILGRRDEVNSDSNVVKNSLIGLIKKNVKDTLSSSEAKTSMPKKVKEMSVTPQNSKGVKKMDMPGKEKRIKLKEDFENKTYAVYELVFGQPYNFYNEEQDKFIYSEPTKATLYTKEEAETVRRKLLEPRVDYYQKTGNNYQEIHVGDLFKKRILKEGLSLAKLLAEDNLDHLEDTNRITNFKSKSGSEGPSHDPYSYNEFSFKKDGKEYIIHMGLAQWIKIDGKKIGAFEDDYDNEEQFIKKHTGIDYKDLQDLMYKDQENYDKDPMGPPSRYMESLTKLKEGLSLAELLAEVTEEIVDETSLNENSPIGGGSFFDQEDLNDAWREIEDEVIEDEGYNDEDLKDSNVDNKLYKITSDRFLTKYGKTFSDFAQDLHSKDSNNFGDFDYDTRDKEAEHDFGPDDLDPAGGYGPRSHMEEADTVRTGNKDYHGIEKYQTTKQTTKGGQFDPKYWEDKDKKSKIPQFTFLPKEIVTKINNKYPGSIQIISQGKDLSMFISQFFYMALSETTRGRYSQDIERKKTELTRYISEVMPPFTRGLIKKQATVTPTKIKETPMHYINIALKPIEAKIKEISGEGVSDSREKAETNARLDLEEKAKNGKIKETEIKRFTGAKGNFKCIILAITKTEDGYLIPLQQEGSNLFQSPWKPMVKDMFTIIYVVRNLKNGKDFEFKNSEKAIEYIGKNGETPTGTPIPLKAIYKVRDNRQGITKEKDKEFDNFEEADKYFNDKTEENSISEEMNDLYESKLRSIISKLIREELN